MPEAKKDSVKIAYTYCLECLDVLDIKDRQLENKKAEIVAISGIVQNKDLEIESLRNTRDILVQQYYQSRKTTKIKWWDGFLKGTVFGITFTGTGLILLAR